MNKKQLEEIKKKCEEIQKLLSSDKQGNFIIENYFVLFVGRIDEELRKIIYEEYLKDKGAKK